MASKQQHYYRPYDSADESGSDSESKDSWFSSGSDQQSLESGTTDGRPNFRDFATKNQLMTIAGRSFSTIKDELKYGIDKLGKYTGFSYYEAPPPEPIPDPNADVTKGEVEIPPSDVETSLIMLDSRYRDRVAYPQPTLFSMRLPRIYKNIKSINMAEIKLLTSFYYFRPTKGNTDISIHEKDRLTYTYENTTRSTIVTRHLTSGSYDINSLQAELRTQLNYTPLFFDYINGINDFIGPFRSSGDFFLNFNQPGDYFYNTTTNLWIQNPSILTIVNKYWKNRYAGLSSYTYPQVVLAYYYPVLNEYIQDGEYSNTSMNLSSGIGIDPTILTTDDVIARILYTFEGINPVDPVVIAVINANIPVLDKYRLEHTFRYWLVNKYVVGLESQSQSIYITSPSLNTSLVNLLNAEQSKYFTRALSINGLSQNEYNSSNLKLNQTLAVLQDMYSFEQKNFLNYFAVPWSQYTLDYYANLTYEIRVRNGFGVIGVPANDTEAISAGIVSFSNNTLDNLRNNPSYYWPNLTNTYSTINGTSKYISTIFMINLSTITSPVSTLNLVYQMNTSNFNGRRTIVNTATSNLYADYLTGNSANAVCPISPAKYTVFKFISPVRQTMQVETFSRPLIYRLPRYNQSNFDTTINKYFNIDYTYSSNMPYDPNESALYDTIYDNLEISNLIQTPGWTVQNALQTNPNYSWNRTFISSFDEQYVSSIPISILTYNRARYFQFTTPQVSNADINSNYTYDLNVSVQFYSDDLSLSTVNAGTDYHMFVYHDRGAFQGDVLSNRSENPEFFKFSTLITATESLKSIPFTTYPQQTYYVILRPDLTNFGNAFVRVAPWFSSNFTVTSQSLSIEGLNPETDLLKPIFSTLVKTNFNYAKVYDSNWIRLPINSNLWSPDPSDVSVNTEYTISNVPLGYDTNGISTDYTDYVPYTFNSFNFTFFPSSNLGIDPITKYQFQSNSQYNSTTQTYIYDGGSNSIFTPGIIDAYEPTTVTSRQEKIVHYYSLNYIPEPDVNFSIGNIISPDSNAQLPYTSTTTSGPIGGYTYGGGTLSNIQLGRGVLGFNFIPQDGIWDVKRVVFRSAINDYANDPNKNIKYMAVYNMGTVLDNATASMNISSALCVLSNSARVTYTSTFTIEDNLFDTKGGTYYEFKKDTSFGTFSNRYILGYEQVRKRMSDQPESMYTLIAFTKYGTPITIKALTGSTVPYPFYNNLYISSAYLDGTKAYNSTQQLLFPSTIGQTNWPFATNLSSIFGPPTGTDQTQSKYATSFPIGTSVINYKSYLTPNSNPNFLYPWSTTLTPTQIIGTVDGYMLQQDTNFNIYKYDTLQASRNFGSALWTFSEDDVYPKHENVSLVAVTGNSSSYYFLGFSNLENTLYKLVLKKYDPFIGTLYNYPLDDISYTVPLGGRVRSFTMNDNEQMVISYEDTKSIVKTSRLYYSVLASTVLDEYIIPNQSTAVHTIDPQTSTLYWISLDPTTNLGTTIYSWSLNNGTTMKSWRTATGSGLPTAWSGLAVNSAVNVPSSNDRLFLINQTNLYSSNIYYSSNWVGQGFPWSTIQIAKIDTAIKTITSQPERVETITTGYRGGLWITTDGTPRVWGHRNSEADLNGNIESAWQIFYPFQKIVIEKIANSYNPMIDQSYVNYPEYPHTQMFYYRYGSKFLLDTTNKWGLENSSNFKVCDVAMSGYYFNSYIFNVPLEKSITPTDFQYLSVRGLTPTESSETLIRFSLPNRYDFGFITQLQIIDEISLYKNDPTVTDSFTSNYGNILLQFDKAFQQSNSFFGQGIIPNFNGSNINSSNFQQFASNMSTVYSGYIATASTVNGITDFTNSNMIFYISTSLRYILPASASTRQNFTDPLTFSILWRTSLLPQYVELLDDWGLGYNLGYNKKDTSYSTYARATSFYKILDDYIYLRLNPQYQMNRLDTTAKEDFKISRDPTGQISSYFGKLLLNGFNTFSRSFVSNQISFNPPIPRLDTMYFQWLDNAGVQLDSTQCDWSASLTIVENKTKNGVNVKVPNLPLMRK
jgi:hypothetical protein